MIGVNKVILVGRAAADPETRTTRSGRPLTRIALAVPRKDAEGNPAVDYFDVTTWAKTAEACARYVRKGEPLYVEGRLTKSTWETENGERRSRVQVTAGFVNFLGTRSAESPPSEVEVEAEAEPAEVASQDPA